MGSASSSQGRGDDDDDDEEDDEEEAEEGPNSSHHNESKVLEQEPEILPCHAPATPISAASTPRVLGPSIRVWDPCNVLLPPSSSLQSGFGAADAGSGAVEVFLISHGECGAGLRPDLVGGRWSTAGLTANGERQARALAVFLNSQGVRFGAVYCSPLDRARDTATFVCRELEFAEEQIKSSDSLIEMSQGQWEGCHRSEIYTPEIINLIDRTQPDFSAPSGESLRQVQFRMIEFLNKTVLRLSEKLTIGETSSHRNDAKGFTRNNSNNSVQDRDGPQWELLYKHRQGLQRKKSGKSRLQSVTTTLDNGIEDDYSQNEASHEHLLHPATAIGIFTHSTPIKCLLTGLLECSPSMSQKICVDDSSVTVLQHSLQTGWQIKRMNDTSHLRLL